MSLLNLTDLPDAKVLEDGTEVKVTVRSAKFKESESGTRYHQLILEIEDEPEVEGIFHTVFMPKDSDEPAQALRTQRRIKDTLVAFDLADKLADFDDEDADIWIGATAWAILKEEEYQGQSRNAIASFVTRG